MPSKLAEIRACVRLCFVLMSAGLLIGNGASAGAQNNLQFSFFQATQSGSASTVLTYAATVTNKGANTVYLNTDTPVFNGPGTIDDTLFYSNFSGPLAAGQSITDQNIFTLTLNSNALPGSYLGSFDILGGNTLTASDLLATQNFGVDVAAVPESSSWLLLTLGLLTLSCGRSMQRKAKG